MKTKRLLVLALLLACIPSARFGEGLPVVDDLDEIGPAARAGSSSTRRATGAASPAHPFSSPSCGFTTARTTVSTSISPRTS